MLVEIAGHEPGLEVGAVEETLPGIHLGLEGWRQGLGAFGGGALLQPFLQQGHFRRRQGRQAEGHAPARIAPFQGVVFLDRRAGLLARQGKVDVPAHRLVGHQRMGRLEVQGPGQETGLEGGGRSVAPLVEDRVEALVAPLGGFLGIDEEAGRRLLPQAGAVIDLDLAAAPGHAFPGAQLDLAGGVVAGVADDAAAVQDGPHLLLEGDGAGPGRIVAAPIGGAEALIQVVAHQGGTAGEEQQQDGGESQLHTGAPGEGRARV